MIVDSHVHPLSDDFKQYPLSPGGGADPDWYIGVHHTAEECLAEMRKAGVDQTVLVNSFGAYGNDNSYCAHSVRRYPDRFAGVARLDDLAPDAPDTLSRWVEGGGIHGVRLATPTPQVYPVCERAIQLGLSVAFQVAPSKIGQVRTVAEHFPNINVILDHLAHPPTQSGPPYDDAREFFALAEVPNIYLKFSTMNLRESAEGRSTTRAFLEALVARFGPARLMWGSDYPHSTGSPADPYRELVDLARESLAFLSPADQEQILAGTVRSLFPSLARATLEQPVQS